MFEGRKIKRLSQEIELSKLEIEKKGLIEIDSLISESNQVQAEDDEAEWLLLGDDSSKRSLDTADQNKLKSQATLAYYKTPHGRNIIRLFEKYICGRGFGLAPKSTLDEVAEWWKSFWKRNRMELKKKEIVRRTMRDGECFIRFFKERGEYTIRFMLPQFVKNPEDKVTANTKTVISSGIETDIDDIEKVINYYYKESPIPAAEVMHIKILVDSDVKRGRSLFEPIIEYLWMYRDWLKDRMKLNKVRATVALIKKVTGTPTQTANIKSANETTTKTNPDGTAKQKAPVGVSVFTTNKNVDYELKSPNLQASDVQHDGRTLILAISAGVGLPEFMVSSDSSNGNYASTMVAEGPAVMEFEDWQDFFALYFSEMFEKVIKAGIEADKIPKTEIKITKTTEKDKDGNVKLIEKKEFVDTLTECSIIFPDIAVRDIQKETAAIILQWREELCSKHTARAKLDLDYEDEEDFLMQEAEEEPDDGSPTKDDEDEMDKEPEDEKPES